MTETQGQMAYEAERRIHYRARFNKEALVDIAAARDFRIRELEARETALGTAEAALTSARDRLDEWCADEDPDPDDIYANGLPKLADYLRDVCKRLASTHAPADVAVPIDERAQALYRAAHSEGSS